MAAIKNQNRIHTRSPFFINAVPTTGSISEADLTLKIQTGTRLASGSMSDLKTYTLNSTNAIDNVIVFNVSDLVRDYIEHKTDPWNTTNIDFAPENQLLYLFWDLTVTRTGGTDDSSGYYVGVEGYSQFNEGVNWQPVTDATGNYGSPTWSPTTAKGTARTIMATDCYRQIGEDSYAIIPIYMGEFDEDNTDSDTIGRIIFGDYTDAITFDGSSDNYQDFTILSSDDRNTGHLANVYYLPIGKKNLDVNWQSGFDYLTFAHLINRKQTSSGAVTTTVDRGNTTGSYNNITETISVPLGVEVSTFDLEVGDNIPIDFPDFSGCATSYSAETINFTFTTDDGSQTIEATIDGTAGQKTLVDCFFNSYQSGEGSIYTLTLPTVSTSNNLAVVNDNPLIRYEIICEPKHRVVDLFFINKWGAWDCFSFLKASRESIDVKSETHYKSIGGISSNAYTYDTQDPQISRYNISANKSYTVNTGYVNESFSLLLEEILVTPRAFMVWEGVRIPVNIKDSRQELKEHVNERLINYTLELEAANDYINNVV